MSMNFDLASAALDYIEAHPAEHDQSWWGEKTECGTTMCFAGHVVTQAGATLRFYGDNQSTNVCVDADGIERFIETYAQELLGIDFLEAEHLFFACDDLNELRFSVNAFDEGRIVSDVRNALENTLDNA